MSTALRIARGLMKCARHHEARSCPFLRQVMRGCGQVAGNGLALEGLKTNSACRHTLAAARRRRWRPVHEPRTSHPARSLADVAVGPEHGQQREVVALAAAEPGVRLHRLLTLAAAGEGKAG